MRPPAALRPGLPATRRLVSRRLARQLSARLPPAVDFPPAVAALIDGVFDAVVDSSVRQMRAYAELLAAAAATVDQFAREKDEDDGD